jgi:hypothetical protein
MESYFDRMEDERYIEGGDECELCGMVNEYLVNGRCEGCDEEG